MDKGIKEYEIYPSMNEVLEGLLQWMTRQIETRMAGKSKNIRLKIIKNSRAAFSIIFETLDFSEQEMNKPMKWSNSDPVLGLMNPNSKVSCLLLYLYSMEIGTP